MQQYILILDAQNTVLEKTVSWLVVRVVRISLGGVL